MGNQKKFKVLVFAGEQEDFGSFVSLVRVLQRPAERGSAIMQTEREEFDVCDYMRYEWTEGKVKVYAQMPGRYVVGEFDKADSPDFVEVIEVADDGSVKAHFNVNCASCLSCFDCPDAEAWTPCVGYSVNPNIVSLKGYQL